VEKEKLVGLTSMTGWGAALTVKVHGTATGNVRGDETVTSPMYVPGGRVEPSTEISTESGVVRLITAGWPFTFSQALGFVKTPNLSSPGQQLLMRSFCGAGFGPPSVIVNERLGGVTTSTESARAVALERKIVKPASPKKNFVKRIPTLLKANSLPLPCSRTNRHPKTKNPQTPRLLLAGSLPQVAPEI
jgi:hypothetical protein